MVRQDRQGAQHGDGPMMNPLCSLECLADIRGVVQLLVQLLYPADLGREAGQRVPEHDQVDKLLADPELPASDRVLVSIERPVVPQGGVLRSGNESTSGTAGSAIYMYGSTYNIYVWIYMQGTWIYRFVRWIRYGMPCLCLCLCLCLQLTVEALNAIPVDPSLPSAACMACTCTPLTCCR